MNHTIATGHVYRDLTVKTEDDAVYVARMQHIELVGWNTSVWIREAREA